METNAPKTPFPPPPASAFERAFGLTLPFGEPSHLANRSAERTKRYLSELAETLPGARRAHEKIFAQSPRHVRGILIDALFRSTVNHARGCLAIGQPLEGASLIESLADDVIARACAHSEPKPPLCVWDPRASLGAATHAAFEALLKKRLPALDVISPTHDERTTLARALDILEDLLPDLAPSTLAHVNLIVVARAFQGKPFKSTTNAYWPGAIVLSTSALSSVADAAESILHEATHLKYIDYEHLFQMYGRGYRPWSSPLVHPPWHAGKDAHGWPLSRAAMAMHVYAVLTVLFRRVLEVEHPAWSQNVAALRETECLSRAKAIEGLLRPHRAAFGSVGHLFIDWIRTNLAALDHPTLSAVA